MRKRDKRLFLLLFLFSHNVYIGQTFYSSPAANTTCSNASGTNVLSNYVPITIAVSGLPSTLSAGGTVLQEVDIQLGSAGANCSQDLSGYSITLTDPGGSVIKIADSLTYPSTNNNWVNIKYRDNANLKTLNSYVSSAIDGNTPHNTGFYRVVSAGSFSNFYDVTGPNGNWTIQISYKINFASNGPVGFFGASLIFGPAITVYQPGNTNSCANAYCIDNTGVTMGSNVGYAPDASYPPISGSCDWNDANNNTAWFEFQATGATVNLSISGETANSRPSHGTKINETQSVIIYAAGCSAADMASSTIPTGGCPIYSSGLNGESDNISYSITGLTAGLDYYLLIDGNSGAQSNFYISATTGMANCAIVLPVTWLSVEATCTDQNRLITWKVANQVNNNYFEILKSKDGIHFQVIGKMKGNQNLEEIKNFEYTDQEYNNIPSPYYKIRQVDMNGKTSDSPIVNCSTNSSEIIQLLPNPFSSLLYLHHSANPTYIIHIVDAIGRIMAMEESTSFNKEIAIHTENWPAGIYFIYLITTDGTSGKALKAIKVNE